MAKYFQFNTGNKLFDSGFNRNLAFQVLYQTFMSRSFGQTQKGYREIGFREIQDLFASMYYFINIGYQDFVKELLFEWDGKTYIKWVMQTTTSIGWANSRDCIPMTACGSCRHITDILFIQKILRY